MTPAILLARGVDHVVVDKPAGILVHRTKLSSDTEAMLGRVRDTVGQWVYAVHRLDRATSGCLLFGLSSEGVPYLQQALRDGQKEYLALVRGQADSLHDTVIDRPLKVKNKLKKAATHIEVLGSSAEPRCSLLRARPLTGRFHQIRRHLAGTGHPILGDSSHGDTRVNRTWREQRGLDRLALHCFRLELPLLEGLSTVRSPIPSSLREVLDALPFTAGLHEELGPHP